MKVAVIYGAESSPSVLIFLLLSGLKFHAAGSGAKHKGGDKNKKALFHRGSSSGPVVSKEEIRIRLFRISKTIFPRYVPAPRTV